MIHYAWVIAFTGTLVLILSQGFGRMSYSLILPSMREGLSLTYTQIGLIASANFVGYLFVAVLGGFVAACFGIRRVIFISLLTMGISIFLTGLSDSFVFAFFMRMITGMGTGGSYIPMMALPAAWFVARKRGLATGIVTLGTGTGIAITAIALPLLISAYGKEGWRFAWYLMGAVVFIMSFVCYAFLRNNPQEKGLSMYGGEEEVKEIPKVTLFSAFKDIVSEKEIWKLSSVYFMYGFSYIIHLTFFAAFLTKEVGLTEQAAGDIFFVLGIFSIFCGVIWGSISDVIGRRYGSMFAYMTLALSYLIFALWKDTVGFYVSSVIFGITAFSIPVIMAAAVGDTVGKRLAPAGLGFITFFFGIGQVLGPTIAGWIKDTTGTFTNALILAAIVSMIGSFGSLILKKKA